MFSWCLHIILRLGGLREPWPGCLGPLGRVHFYSELPQRPDAKHGIVWDVSFDCQNFDAMLCWFWQSKDLRSLKDLGCDDMIGYDMICEVCFVKTGTRLTPGLTGHNLSESKTKKLPRKWPPMSKQMAIVTALVQLSGFVFNSFLLIQEFIERPAFWDLSKFWPFEAPAPAGFLASWVAEFTSAAGSALPTMRIAPLFIEAIQ